MPDLLDSARQAIFNGAHRNAITEAFLNLGITATQIDATADTWTVSDLDAANAIIDDDTQWFPHAKNFRINALSDLYIAKYVEGFNYNGKNFQIDAVSLQNINGASSMALVALTTGSTWPTDFTWIASDNSQMAVSTPAAMIAFGVAVGQYVTALVMTNFALKQAVRAATTATDIDTIDITQGWPSNTL